MCACVLIRCFDLGWRKFGFCFCSGDSGVDFYDIGLDEFAGVLRYRNSGSLNFARFHICITFGYFEFDYRHE